MTASRDGPVLERDAPAQAFFEGPYVEDGAGIVPNGFDHSLSDRLVGEPFAETETAWNHERDGGLLAAGEGIDAAEADRHPFDVGPTVLASLEVAPSDRMAGTVPLTERLDDRVCPGYAERDSGRAVELENRLADPGYVE